MWRKGEMAQSAILVKQAPLPSPQAAVDTGTAARSFSPVSSKSQVGTSRDESTPWPMLRFCQGSVGFTNSSIAFGPGAFLGEVDLLVDEDDLELNTSIVAFEDAEVPQDPMPCFLCISGLWPRGGGASLFVGLAHRRARSRCAQTCARTRAVGYWFDTSRAAGVHDA